MACVEAQLIQLIVNTDQTHTHTLETLERKTQKPQRDKPERNKNVIVKNDRLTHVWQAHVRTLRADLHRIRNFIILPVDSRNEKNIFLFSNFVAHN